MPELAEIRKIRLHFEGAGVRDHRIPAEAIVQALNAFQRTVHLLGMEHEGRAVRQRARPTAEIRRKYVVTCALAEEGGYAQPCVIGDDAQRLFDADAVEAVAGRYKRTLEALSAEDEAGLEQELPDAYWRSMVLDSVRQTFPSERSNFYLVIEGAENRPIFGGADAPAKVARLSARRETLTTPGVVTGQLIRLEFPAHRMTIQYPPTGRLLECVYADNVEPLLLENPRELIQVRGNVATGDDGNPVLITDVAEILEVDESSFQVEAFEVNGQRIEARQDILVPVTFSREDYCYYTEDAPFGIYLTANTRPELEESLYQELAFLWAEYALAEDDELSEDAVALKEVLRASFGRA